MQEKGIPTGDLTFLTDGHDYVCIWHPVGEDFRSKNARPLALISTRLIKDKKDFNQWRKDICARWAEAAQEILGVEPGNIQIEEIPLEVGPN